MNTTIVRLSGGIVLLLAAYSMASIAQAQQPLAHAPDELALQTELGKEALRLRLRQLEIYKETSKLRSQGSPVPPEMLREMNALEFRQKEIAQRQFALSGRLVLTASEPGVFGAYIAECLNRINRALNEEDPELRRRFYGKTAWVQLDLTAGGMIESVVPGPSKQDKEFGDYLHDLVWKVSTFPEVPQLESRKIERVSLSIPFTLQKAQP